MSDTKKALQQVRIIGAMLGLTDEDLKNECADKLCVCEKKIVETTREHELSVKSGECSKPRECDWRFTIVLEKMVCLASMTAFLTDLEQSPSDKIRDKMIEHLEACARELRMLPSATKIKEVM